jgi:hypothetical protein
MCGPLTKESASRFEMVRCAYLERKVLLLLANAAKLRYGLFCSHTLKWYTKYLRRPLPNHYSLTVPTRHPALSTSHSDTTNALCIFMSILQARCGLPISSINAKWPRLLHTYPVAVIRSLPPAESANLSMMHAYRC